VALDMFRHNEIARALRLLCQSAVALSADAEPGDEVQVGSNELFSVGDQVVLGDSAGEEQHTVDETVGLTVVRFQSAIQGSYLVSRGARLSLQSARLAGLQWVGQGRPELLPRLPTARFPCVLVLPGEMRQPFNAGGNRTFQQDYKYRLFYVEQYQEGQTANIHVLDRAADLFNLLMEDTYLGGTCWHSQVTQVNPEPDVQDYLREQERPLRVVEVTVLARRAAVWNK
jgi:hypothetical protein